MDKYRERGFFVSQNEFLLNRPELCSIKSQKVFNFRFLQLVSLEHKAIHPVASFTLSSKTQADLEAAETQNQEAYQSKSVNVKFQLQKECMFGEQFLIVGDDSTLGLWDPSSAIPLNWSDGHVWTAELEMPIGKSIQFKFILKGSAEKILWQPGPDRIFETWETKNTITICEDWENPEFQKVIEEEQLANLNEPTTENSDMLIVAENLTHTKDESVSSVNKGSATAYSNTSPAEKPVAEAHKERIIADNIAPSQENPKAIVADNISYSKEDPKVNDSDPKEESTAIPNREALIAENILGSNGRAPTNIEGNLINHQGGPVLVPGLTPFSTEPTEKASQDEGDNRIAVDAAVGTYEAKDHKVQEASQDESEKRNAVDASIGTYEAKGHNVPELDEKQEPDGDPPQLAPTKIFNDVEAQLERKFKQKHHLPKREEQHDSTPIDNKVLQNDIQWGRKTLQKILTNLGLL